MNGQPLPVARQCVSENRKITPGDLLLVPVGDSDRPQVPLLVALIECKDVVVRLGLRLVGF